MQFELLTRRSKITDSEIQYTDYTSIAYKLAAPIVAKRGK